MNNISDREYNRAYNDGYEAGRRDTVSYPELMADRDRYRDALRRLLEVIDPSNTKAVEVVAAALGEDQPREELAKAASRHPRAVKGVESYAQVKAEG